MISESDKKSQSFELNSRNFPIEQYKSHNVSDWIGEHNNSSTVNGFRFRGGRNPETIGIWIWSEVFTHDFANGDKVAIILVDTQGIFDSRSSVHDCTTVLALSMMLSSVQCYNIMQNIREDDLQHLELFTEYARLALERSDEKPFQKLLFIIRDWPYAFETAYGWNGQNNVINDFLSENDDQTQEMRVLRARIKVSFDEIQAFLMPHPGCRCTREQFHRQFVRRFAKFHKICQGIGTSTSRTRKSHRQKDQRAESSCSRFDSVLGNLYKYLQWRHAT